MRSRRLLGVVVALCALALSGTVMAAPRQVPVPENGQALVDATPQLLAGDRAALEWALRENDLGSFIGADLLQAGVTVEELTYMVHTAYEPRAVAGDTAGGLARLISRLNLRIAPPLAETISPSEALRTFLGYLTRGDTAALARMAAPEGLVVDHYRPAGAPFTGPIGAELDRTLAALFGAASPKVEAYSLSTDRRVDLVVSGLNRVQTDLCTGEPCIVDGRVKLSLRQEQNGAWRFWLLAVDDLGLLEQEIQSGAYQFGAPASETAG
jgi:hypothetical protein